MSALRRSRTKVKSVDWVTKLKSGVGIGLISFVLIVVITGATVILVGYAQIGRIVSSQEAVRGICLWVGSLLFLGAVPGCFAVYLHDYGSEKRRIYWLRVMSGILVFGVILVCLAVPIAQFLSTVFGSNLLSSK